MVILHRDVYELYWVRSQLRITSFLDTVIVNRLITISEAIFYLPGTWSHGKYIVHIIRCICPIHG